MERDGTGSGMGNGMGNGTGNGMGNGTIQSVLHDKKNNNKIQIIGK